MIDEPVFFAERPDALSEVLDAIHLSGGALTRCATADRIAVAAGRRLLHVVEAGPVRLRVGEVETKLGAGDMALLVRGDAHELGSADGSAARAPRPADLDPDGPPAGYSGPRWLTGTFNVDDAAADDLLGVLPAVIVVPREPGTDWLDLSVSLLLAEITGTRPGATVMIARILDLLFIHILRAWTAQDAERTPGWLTAALDPQIGRAVAAIHHDLARPWTVGELAAAALLSRTVFAERFLRLVGSTPVAYLAVRRLDRAAELLRTTTAPVADIGRTVGYTSEAAFSRAFARRHGAPPLRWRRGG